MRHLLNSLYVLTPEAYLSLAGENVVVKKGDSELGRYPLHGLEQITCFSYYGMSPALMGKCSEYKIETTFFSQNGKFLARVGSGTNGNVLLRRKQYRIADTAETSLGISKNFIIGKVYNSRWILERATRDHPLSVDVERLKRISLLLRRSLHQIESCTEESSLRGIEGEAANLYFSVFNELILRKNAMFEFNTRNRRPPLDNVNALLSFAYSLLANNCASSLESVGLDPYVGFMHSERPGRISLALDLMEELRPVMADRFVLSGINNGVFSEDMFEKMQSGAVFLNEKGKKAFLGAWKSRRDEKITHPFLKEKLPWGLVPHTQALLLARFIRGDLDEYPPFLWK